MTNFEEQPKFDLDEVDEFRQEFSSTDFQHGKLSRRLVKTFSECSQATFDHKSHYSVDPDCAQCGRVFWCRRHSEFDLLHYEQVPDYVQDNPYVTHGYRPEMPFALVLKSLFVWSNETINIWSHLLGLVYFSLCLAYDNLYTLPRMRSQLTDHLVFSITLITFQTCMLFSAAYHLFYCMSAHAHKVWLSLDMLGVSVGLLGIYFSGIYYSFYCDHMLHNTYLSIFFLLALSTLAGPFYPDYTSKRLWGARMALYLAVVLYGILPTVHWVYLHGLHSDLTWRFVPRVVVVYLLSAAAFICYATKIPEYFKPGKFNFVGHSHQWWHIMTFLAFVWWRYSGLDLLQYRLANQCPT